MSNEQTARRGHVAALRFADHGGTELNDMLTSIATTKSLERLGIMQMFCVIENVFVDDDRNSIPVPGSKMGETGNLPYDRYTSEVTTKDGKRKVPGSWYTDAIRATVEAERIAQRIIWLDGETEGMPEDIQRMGTVERKVEIKTLRQRLTDMRKGLSQGCMLWLHTEEVGKFNPELIRVKMPVRPIKGDPDNIEAYSNMIRLQDPTGTMEDKSFTVSEFLALDLSKMPTETDKQDIAALEATKARAPRGSNKAGKDKKAALPVPTTVEDVLRYMNVLGTALDTNTDEGNKLLSKLIAKTAIKGEAGTDAIETIGDFVMAIDDNVWTVINASYNAIKIERRKRMNAAAV